MYSDFRIVKKTMMGGNVHYNIEGKYQTDEIIPEAWEVYAPSPWEYLETIEDARKAKERAMNTIVLSTEVVE